MSSDCTPYARREQADSWRHRFDRLVFDIIRPDILSYVLTSPGTVGVTIHGLGNLAERAPKAGKEQACPLSSRRGRISCRH